MTLIDGVGDEVTQFVIVVVCGVVILLAWWSTGYRQERFRTVVLMERNVRRLYRLIPRRATVRVHRNEASIRWTPISVTHRAPAPDTSEPQENSSDSVSQQTQDEQSVPEQAASTTVLSDTNTESSLEVSTQDLEMDTIVNAMDTDSCALRNRRLAYFSNQPEGNLDSSLNDTVESQQSTESDHSQENLEKETEDKKDDKSSTADSDESDDKETKTDNIRIRLKYLNDDQKLVEGNLQEPLGEFKRRHFSGELSTRKLVRLIFNGQVLQREGATLASCGLFDNCVVHCLIHQPKTASQFAQVQQQLNPTIVTPENNVNNGVNAHLHDGPPSSDRVLQEERDWNLSHILLTILASILSIAWYCHIQFSSLFGVAASIAMLGLTALYFIAVICVYYPESQQNTVNPPTPVNNNETAETNNAE